VQMVFEDLGSGLGNCDMVYSPRNKFLAKPWTIASADGE
jgi:hypothetical protein